MGCPWANKRDPDQIVAAEILTIRFDGRDGAGHVEKGTVVVEMGREWQACWYGLRGGSQKRDALAVEGCHSRKRHKDEYKFVSRVVSVMRTARERRPQQRRTRRRR